MRIWPGVIVSDQSSQEITELLQAWSGGDEDALAKLTPLVYPELHRMAQRYMANERADATLQTTALVNELYLRVFDVRRIPWKERTHFFAVCAQLMRRVLVDCARARRSLKRGGRVLHVQVDENAGACVETPVDLLALDEALNRLADFDVRKSRVVELRFFGGLEVEETAEVLNVSSETVMRDWKLAKSWLMRELKKGHHHEP
jgi:RNA polymerase sigma factor (TIGR02999 family)